MRTPRQVWIPVILLALSLTACDSYQKVVKSNDVNLKLTKANEYYDKGKYMSASEVYYSIIPMVKGTKNYEPVYYRYAYSLYNMKDYLRAGYHFKNFTQFFPTSKDAEEMEFMHALCLFKESPKSSLEQTNTIQAMEALQSFINTRGDSKRVTEANKLMEEGRAKLEDKEAGAAKLYYNIGQYKAAAISYKGVMREYPESAISDYYQFMVVRANYLFAKESVTEKQEERYATVRAAYNELKELYPKSRYLKEGAEIADLADEKTKQLRSKNERS
jgi:outer membrane protein assembly factor BamD